MKIIMGNIMAIYRKELQGYFQSPLAYAIAGVFWLISGLFFTTILLGPEGVIAQAAALELQGKQLGMTIPPLDVPYEFLKLFLGVLGQLSLFILPMLSMGLYSEERKLGTLELLATSPITNWAVAVGKLLGVVTFYITMLLPLIACETIVLSASNPPFPLTIPLLGHLGLILMSAGVLSLGMFISSLTDSTILSAIITFVLVVILSIIDLVANNIGGPLGAILGHLSILKHYTNMLRGVLDSSSLILFATYIIFGVFLTAQTIETLRFQRA